MGQGYDACTLADAGYAALGLDLAPTAVDLAQKTAAKRGSKAAFLVGDFFAFPPPAPFAATFDVIWDYTFFCALPPELRPRWAARTAELLKRDGGVLATVRACSIIRGLRRASEGCSLKGPPEGVY